MKILTLNIIPSLSTLFISFHFFEIEDRRNVFLGEYYESSRSIYLFG